MFNLSKTPKHICASADKNPTMRIVAMEEGETPELIIMDSIGKDFWGDGIAASEVVSFLSKHKDSNVKARFNSFGGDAYEGLVMHNSFAQHGNVTAVIEGIAFSAAAIAAAGANKVVMQKQSNFGIHRAWTVAMGNVNGLKASVEWLESVDEHQINIFGNRTGEDRETVIGWLEGTDDGTVFDAEESKTLGFADEILGEPQADPKPASSARKRFAAEVRHRRAMARLRG